MIVVTDTSPINYLVLIEHIDVLPALFERVMIPQAVVEELLDERTPEIVRQWITAPPAWCVIEPPRGALDPELAYLGDGEREAIALCQDLGAEVLVTDDSRARREARVHGIGVIRTLALLERAAVRGLLDLPAALAKLQATTFYAPAQIISEMLARHAARRPGRTLRPPEP